MAGIRYGAVVNDFGALNIEAGLIVESTADTISLTNGCVCCNARDDLVQAVHQIWNGKSEIDHIVIETSGISHLVVF